MRWLLVVLISFAGCAVARSQMVREESGRRPAGSLEVRTPRGIGSQRSLQISEALSGQLEQQLSRLGKLIARPTEALRGWEQELHGLVTPECIQPELRPHQLSIVFQDGNVTVRRGASNVESESSGLVPFGQAIEWLRSVWDEQGPAHVKFKTFRMDREDEQRARTSAYFHFAAQSSDGPVEQTATWQLDWQLADGKARIEGIRVSEFEEIQSTAASAPWFGDATAHVIGATSAFQQHVQFGIEHWRDRMPPEVVVDFRGHHGLAIGDVNNDGRDDAFVCQPAGLPNLLFLQQPDGSTLEVARQAGIDWLDASKSALMLDLDNDGDQDLVISLKDQVVVLNQVTNRDGIPRFRIAARLAGPRRPHGMSAADYDLDGDLDIYVCGFWRHDVYSVDPLRTALSLPTPWHDANNGAPNHLFRNDGELTFSDVTQESGLDEKNKRFSHSSGWEDFDQDGDPDLYVANDFGRNNLYRNDNGRFTDVAAEWGVEDQAAGMSVSWADYNRDGWSDLYVSNMFSSAGGRITYHREFQTRMDAATRSEFRRHARGNTLFRASLSGGPFTDVSESASVALGRWAWGSVFLDANNDGWEDLFVANGFVTNEDSGDL